MEQSQCSMNEQQKLTDLLCSQKFVTSTYNSYYCEAATPAVKTCLSSILEDEHHIQQQIFTEMNNRGFYPLEKAEDTKLTETKQKYGQAATV